MLKNQSRSLAFSSPIATIAAAAGPAMTANRPSEPQFRLGEPSSKGRLDKYRAASPWPVAAGYLLADLGDL
jgi:hypothetical protein